MKREKGMKYLQRDKRLINFWAWALYWKIICSFLLNNTADFSSSKQTIRLIYFIFDNLLIIHKENKNVFMVVTVVLDISKPLNIVNMQMMTMITRLKFFFFLMYRPDFGYKFKNTIQCIWVWHFASLELYF